MSEEDQMTIRGRAALLFAGMLALSACAAPAALPTPVPPADTPTPAAPATPTAIDIPNVVCVGEATTYLDWLEGTFEPDDPDPITQPTDTAGDLLEIVRDRGVLRISSDSDYAPQSFLQPDGTFAGFDVDVGTEIATRLGVDVEFNHVDWDLITAGSWAERWDVSVGSMTITTPRKVALSFTRPYYFTPAGLAVSARTGITNLAELPFEVPGGVTATTLPTDANCAEAIRADRGDFELWVSALPTINEAIAQGIELVIIGDPIYTEGLAVAIDKSGPPHDALLYEIDRIIGEMHADGTLTELSLEWYGEDITQDPEAN
jgi:polar amino acid transport system substrate-binding protein